MPDPVTDAVADLTTKMQSLSAISNKIIYMFDSDDLLSEQGKIGVPSIGVVYNSLRGNQTVPHAGAAGLAATIVVDIYIIGGQQCVEKISRETGVKTTTTQLLDDIRNCIKLTKPQDASGNDRPQMQRPWKFVVEQPVPLDDGVIAYVQRWETKVMLT